MSEARLQKDVKKLQMKIMSLHTAQEQATEKQKKVTEELTALSNRLSALSVKAVAARKRILFSINLRFQRQANLTLVSEKLLKSLRLLQIELTEKQARLFMETEQRALDNDVVNDVFSLHASIEEQNRKFDNYVEMHLMTIDDENPHLSYVSSNNLRKVVISKTTRTLIHESGAADALALVKEFFKRFEKNMHLKPEVKALYELTEKILVERRGFRVGPGLYDFLNLEFKSEDFPELHDAQEILRKSLYSQTSSRYVRLYERQSVEEKWTPR